MSIFTVNDLSKKQIEQILNSAIEFKKGKQLNIEAHVMHIFLEPSTRTTLSFEMAESKLGMKVHNFSVENSSFTKGESLEDTIFNFQAIGFNNFVIRTREENYWTKFNHSNVKIINGGDGTKNHPSQALLDALTIFEEFTKLSGLKVLFVGDVSHSRVYHSLKDLLVKFDSTVDAIGPKSFEVDEIELTKVIHKYDVVIMLRIQHERHQSKFDITDYNTKWGLNEKTIKLLKEDAIFMHPGPVNQDVEIAKNITYAHPKSRILKQVENGVYVRQAMWEFVWKNM